MNPLIALLLIALAALVLIVLAAAVLSAILVAAGEKYAARQRKELEERLLALLPGADCAACGCESCRLFAQQLHSGSAQLQQCTRLSEQSSSQLQQLLQDWENEKTRVREAAEESRKKRGKRKNWFRANWEKM